MDLIQLADLENVLKYISVKAELHTSAELCSLVF